MNDTNREKIKARIRALLNMTTARGASEGEAMKAAEMAGRLMAEYELDYADVGEVQAEKYGARRKPGFRKADAKRRTAHEVVATISYIGTFCRCRTAVFGGDLVYFGTETDTMVAHQLTDIIRLAMDAEWGKYLIANRTPEIHGKTLRASFMAGMTRRLNTRLTELTDEKAAATESRNALVVVKNQVVAERYEKFKSQLGYKTAPLKTSQTIRNDQAYGAGKEAGDRVGLNPNRVGAQKVIGSQ